MANETAKEGLGPEEKSQLGLHHEEKTILPLREEAQQDAIHIDLSWRSWVRRHVAV
jgi:hypothetical protein